MSGNTVLCIKSMQLKCPPDYHSWLETIYNLFGTKWCNIFAGPLWSYAPVAQANEHQTSMKEPSKICASTVLYIPNLACDFQNISQCSCSIRAHNMQSMAASDFTLGTNIQVCILYNTFQTLCMYKFLRHLCTFC